jgi:hypothetical protein
LVNIYVCDSSVLKHVFSISVFFNEPTRSDDTLVFHCQSFERLVARHSPSYFKSAVRESPAWLLIWPVQANCSLEILHSKSSWDSTVL